MFSSQGPRLLVLLICLCGYTVLQLLTWPWRGKITNFADLIVSVSLIATSIVGCLLTKPSDEVRTVAQVVLVSSFCALIIVLIAFLGRSAMRSIAGRKKEFKYFLSHHKAAAGCMARYMQQLLEGEGKTFLDSDHLQDLDMLIDTVRKDVDVLVVILTEDIFWRPWCAAEITTCVLNDIPIQLCAVEGYSRGPDLLDGDLYEKLRASIPESDLDGLGSYEIGHKEIEKAYRHVGTLPIHYFPVGLQNKSTSWRMEDTALLKKVLAQYEVEAGKSEPNVVNTPLLKKTDYVVVAEPDCMEAVAIAKTFGHIIAEMTHEPTHTVSFPNIDKTDVPHLFVVLSPGILSTPEGLATIVLAVRYKVPYCAIQSDCLGFAFPTSKFYERLVTPNYFSSTMWTKFLALLDLGPEFTPSDLADHLHTFFRVITVQYAAMGPLKLISSQADIALRRVQKERSKWEYTTEERKIRKTMTHVSQASTLMNEDPEVRRGRPEFIKNQILLRFAEISNL